MTPDMSPGVVLDQHLGELLNLKPPGANNTKISAITELCNTNVNAESLLITRIYTHLKKTPPSHKLGVLYVVDSVTRGWVERAKKSGQSLQNGPTTSGTYAAGVSRVTELLPSIMNDIINAAPREHKEKILKLVQIWERSQTFPAGMLAGFTGRLSASEEPAQSTTPVASPPAELVIRSASASGSAAAPAPAQNASSILQALANMAKSTPAGDVNASGAGINANPLIGASTNAPLDPGSSTQQMRTSVGNSAPMNVANLFGAASSNSSVPGNVPGPSIGVQTNATGQVSPEVLQQQIQMIQLLQAQGVPQDQMAAVLTALMSAGAVGGQGVPNPAFNGAAMGQPWQSANQAQTQPSSRDPNAFSNAYGRRSPPNRRRDRRSRSRSPQGIHRGNTPPRRRDSPLYGGSRRDGGSGDHRDYRQRSPDRGRRGDSPNNGNSAAPRHFKIDRTLRPGTIRVLSRTLFVGGVTCSEPELRTIFSKYGEFQSAIIQVERRHAFVKMKNRPDAVRAKEATEHVTIGNMALRTRWGVGFGPRDCSNYQTGISVIPIDRLTDADRKWMVNAEYGGTGGAPIAQYQEIEEPDIEIGAGVSSKAISRRIATDTGGQQGPRSSYQPGPYRDRFPNQRYREPDRRVNNDGGNDDDRDNYNRPGNGSNDQPVNINNNFNFPGMPNGFPFNPGFIFPNGFNPQQQ